MSISLHISPSCIFENNNGIVLSIFGRHSDVCVCVSYDVWYTFLPPYIFWIAAKARTRFNLRLLLLQHKKMLPAENPENAHMNVCVRYHSRRFLIRWLICGDSRLNVLFSDKTGCDILLSSVVKIEKLLNLMTDFLVAKVKNPSAEVNTSLYASHRFTCSSNKFNKYRKYLTCSYLTGLCTTLCLSSE